jgi:hypothetical protein
MAEGGLVYAEYLDGTGVDDGNAFIRRDLKWGVAAEPAPVPDEAAQERARNWPLFSNEK